MSTDETRFLEAMIDALGNAIKRVKDLHEPVGIGKKTLCHCGVAYPCPTINALDGNQ